MDPLERRVKPVEVELGRNLQTYLQRLGLLPRKPPAFRLSAPGQVDPPPSVLLSMILSSAKLVNTANFTEPSTD